MPEKILIIRFSSFGDIVLTFPLINLLKKKFPNANISFVVKPQYSELVKINPLIDEVIEFDEHLKLDFKKYDLIIDLQNNPKSKAFTFAAGTKILRYKKDNFKKFLLVRFKINLFKEIIPVYKRYIQTLKDVISLTEKDYTFTTSELKSTNLHFTDKKYIVIAPSSKHFTKRYPKEKYLELIITLKEKYQIILTGDDSNTDREICNYLCKDDKVISYCGKLSYPELAYVLKNSEFVISNDSGVMHFAESLGKKVYAIFGSTVKEFGFFPQLETSKVFEYVGLYCRPCTHIGLNKCPEGHFKCMLENKVEIN
ncbi:MAG TPA: glycosyltransferase family 9 protein [Ignavibacteria bacterium]|nr:glycosyltransferase family 9 protein [Ignavibacteria bacterium]